MNFFRKLWSKPQYLLRHRGLLEVLAISLIASIMVFVAIETIHSPVGNTVEELVAVEESSVELDDLLLTE